MHTSTGVFCNCNFVNIKLCGASADVHANVDYYYFVILTELIFYVIYMTSSFVNTCVMHMSFTVFDNVVYSVSSAEAHAWSRIHFL